MLTGVDSGSRRFVRASTRNSARAMVMRCIAVARAQKINAAVANPAIVPPSQSLSLNFRI
jgi:hypothetical protein